MCATLWPARGGRNDERIRAPRRRPALNASHEWPGVLISLPPSTKRGSARERA